MPRICFPIGRAREDQTGCLELSGTGGPNLEDTRRRSAAGVRGSPRPMPGGGPGAWRPAGRQQGCGGTLMGAEAPW
ncbi:hypothetical protein NDU88_011622 [Pleurodeles waltl]|uniref:Uncharacterized protein n=1 Tax=Pleurodeles waltl TaxID=8319 RepID=A0AAV7S5D9_PLEWA|nr:hypothetical protein NDU88_011622 [Pleurodeles waltl]